MSKFFKWLKKDKQNEESITLSNDETEQPVDQVIQHETVTETEIKNSDSETSAGAPEQLAAEDIAREQEDFVEAPEISSETTLTDVAEKIENDCSYKDKVEIEQNEPLSTTELQPAEATTTDDTEQAKSGFFGKLKRGLSRTKESIGSGIVTLFRGKAIDDELFEELETQLLVADVGMDTTSKIIQHLTEGADRKQLKDGDALYSLLKDHMADILDKVDAPLTLKSDSGPFVILMVGVNGVGKTTTIGKMAKQFQQQGKKVMLAAGDTFRAAAVEQLQVWGDRNDIPVVAQQTGSDSASVIFDAFQSAKAKNIDVLIADTAGRLQNKDHLMEELKKVVRVMKKISAEAPHEIMLTLDAGTGQNAVSQTKLFHEAVGLTGISLTKLDGTAKGGVIFAIADQFDIPIRYVGIGEAIEDLRPFASRDFVDALFSEPEQ